MVLKKFDLGFYFSKTITVGRLLAPFSRGFKFVGRKVARFFPRFLGWGLYRVHFLAKPFFRNDFNSKAVGYPSGRLFKRLATLTVVGWKNYSTIYLLFMKNSSVLLHIKWPLIWLRYNHILTFWYGSILNIDIISLYNFFQTSKMHWWIVEYISLLYQYFYWRFWNCFQRTALNGKCLLQM